MNSENWKLGQRYTYATKEYCYKIGKHVESLGYEVRFGASWTGLPYFEIVDPFKRSD